LETTVNIKISETPEELGKLAAADAARVIRQAIEVNGEARVIVATGASQFAFLTALAKEGGVEWSRVTCFHLDEYLGMPDTHPASFRRYLRERVVAPLAPKHFEFVDGTAPDPEAECARVGALLRAKPIDVAFVGIGENGHLAFNDPPADFTTDRAYIIVELDEPCRRQQLGEGWFATLDDVPRRAISMSIPQILKAVEILCIVPDQRKAQAVHECLDGAVTPLHPASALQQHGRTTFYLDRNSSSKLQRRS
jgi:glucosamine-6-phosphate deaminase